MNRCISTYSVLRQQSKLQLAVTKVNFFASGDPQIAAQGIMTTRPALISTAIPPSTFHEHSSAIIV